MIIFKHASIMHQKLHTRVDFDEDRNRGCQIVTVCIDALSRVIDCSCSSAEDQSRGAYSAVRTVVAATSVAKEKLTFGCLSLLSKTASMPSASSLRTMHTPSRLSSITGTRETYSAIFAGRGTGVILFYFATLRVSRFRSSTPAADR